MTTVLVTGAVGFLGKQVLKHLAKTSVTVIPVVRPGQEAQIVRSDNIKRALLTPNLFVESSAALDEMCSGVDIVIHTAWSVKEIDYLRSTENLSCLTGTLSLATAAARSGVRRFVGIGSCAEYGFDSTDLNENSELKPKTLYGAAKASSFLSLNEYFNLNAVSFAWCRVFYLYGEGEPPQRLFSYLRDQLDRGEPALLSSGTQVRDYLDVADAASRICQVALSDLVGAVNICSGVAQTIRDLSEKIADEYGRRDLLKFYARPENSDDPKYVVGDNKKFSERFGGLSESKV